MASDETKGKHSDGEDKRKDRRKRVCIKIYLDKEKLADIDSRRRGVSRAAWCRDRIFASENFHDPLFDVASRLAAIAASCAADYQSVARLCDASTALERTLRLYHDLDPATRSVIEKTTLDLRAAIEALRTSHNNSTHWRAELTAVAREVLELLRERQQSDRARASQMWSRHKT